jgi:hypothetical protein
MTPPEKLEPVPPSGKYVVVLLLAAAIIYAVVVPEKSADPSEKYEECDRECWLARDTERRRQEAYETLDAADMLP